MKDGKKTISEFCKQERAKTGLSKNAFAISRGITHTTVAKFESGFYDSDPSPLILSRLVKNYNFDIEKCIEYGIDINQEYVDTFNRLNNTNNPGTPSIKGNTLSKTFLNLFREKNPNIIVTEFEKKEEKSTNFTYQFMDGMKRTVSYVYVFNDLSSVNSDRDFEKIETRLNQVVVDSLRLEKDKNGKTLEIIILVGSKKIFDFIVKNYSFKFNYLSDIKFKAINCPCAAYSTNDYTIIDL